MPWYNDKFYYTSRLLKTIAYNYCTIYDGIPQLFKLEITNPWAIAEYKADFDRALDGIGRGRWTGQTLKPWPSYRNYGREQQAIIADILGVEDNVLIRLGFYNLAQLKGYGYYLMKTFLNGG